MAAKIKVMKMLQEIRGFAQVTNRRPPARHPDIALIPGRSPVLAPAASRKRVLSINVQEPLGIPDPVRIKHVNSRARRAEAIS